MDALNAFGRNGECSKFTPSRSPGTRQAMPGQQTERLYSVTRNGFEAQRGNGAISG
jgi:hypothetical protein